MKKRINKSYKSFINYMKNIFRELIDIIKEINNSNPLLFLFVIINVINSLLLRAFTIGTIENIIYPKPIVADITIVLLIGSFSYFIKPKNRIIFFGIWTIVLTAICVINSAYYTFYTSFSSISLIATSKFISEVGDAVVENVLQVKDILYIWAPIFLIAIYFKSRKKHDYSKKKFIKKDFWKVLLIDAVLLFGLIITIKPLEISRLTNQWNREYLVMRFGIYTYHVNDFVKSMQPKISSLFGYDNAMRKFKEYYAEEKKPITNSYTNIFKGKNIIVIHAESIQSVTLGLKFNGQEVTPTLNRLAREGLYFSNYYAQVSVGTSSDTEFTFNTGLLPVKSGTVNVNYFNREYVSIPKLLKEQGYYTFSMHGNTGDFWNRNAMHKNLGYDKFYSKSSFVIDEKIGLGISDMSFFRQTVEKIKEINEKGKPYYGTLISLSNHTPFSDVDKYGEFDVDIKEEITNEFGETETVSYPYMEGTKLGNYFKSVHYADSAIGEFMTLMEQEGLLENTVIVVYGDHDARLPLSDYVRLYNYDKETNEVLDKEDPNYKVFDSYQYELNRKVPFIIWTKNSKNNPLLNKEITTVMGMYNAMPTLGNMFGFFNKYALGKDIFNTLDDNLVVFSNSNWVTNKVYYNSQKEEYLALSDTVISDEYIKANNEAAIEALEVSDSIIVFDLIKKSTEEVVNEAALSN